MLGIKYTPIKGNVTSNLKIYYDDKLVGTPFYEQDAELKLR